MMKTLFTEERRSELREAAGLQEAALSVVANRLMTTIENNEFLTMGEPMIRKAKGMGLLKDLERQGFILYDDGIRGYALTTNGRKALDRAGRQHYFPAAKWDDPTATDKRQARLARRG